MQEIFSYDSWLGRAINKVADFFCLGLMWIIFSIPVITIGASTTALYYTVNKVLRHGNSSIWRAFGDSFKENFKQATIIWLIVILLYAVWILGCYFAYILYLGNVFPQFCWIVMLVITAIMVAWSCYLFPYAARFTNSVKDILKNSLIMAMMNMGSSVMVLLVVAVAIIAMWSTAVGILYIPTAVALAFCFIMERVFRKYMSPEDLAAEEERNGTNTEEVP